MLEMIGPARPARQSLTFGSLGVTSAAEAPDLMRRTGAFAATAAPGKLARRGAASPDDWAARAPVVPPRSPQWDRWPHAWRSPPTGRSWARRCCGSSRKDWHCHRSRVEARAPAGSGSNTMPSSNCDPTHPAQCTLDDFDPPARIRARRARRACMREETGTPSSSLNSLQRRWSGPNVTEVSYR